MTHNMLKMTDFWRGRNAVTAVTAHKIAHKISYGCRTTKNRVPSGSSQRVLSNWEI